jgi:hypothetical protein
MIDAWKVVLEPQFHRDYPNATLIITPESPLHFACDKMRELKNVVRSFVFYSDDVDARDKYARSKLDKMLWDPLAIEKLQVMPVPRSETIQVSGSEMRQFLKSDDRESFDRYVPQTLNQEMKDTYWSILKGTYGDIQDSKQRNLLKVLFESMRRDR